MDDVERRKFLSGRVVQTVSGAHPASSGVKLTTHHQLVQIYLHSPICLHDVLN
jgi:hypothetical protein